jgi:ParB-like chromosome segregation protein Spo0J
MDVEKVKIDTLTADPSNARAHSERNIDAITRSLKRFGQQKPIVVDRDGVVVAGNGTLRAAIALGWEEIAAVRTDLAGDEARAFAIADNRTAELATWEDETLRAQLAALAEVDEDLLRATGFDSAIDTLGTLNAEAAPPEDFPEVDENISTDRQCPRCGYRWSAGEP